MEDAFSFVVEHCVKIMVSQSRRNLLRYFAMTAGCYVVTASSLGLSGCRHPLPKPDTEFSFPQGVASGDPQSDAVILWTRVEGAQKEIALSVQLSTDSDFNNIISESSALASTEWDHTVRVLVEGLDSNSFYYYRFLAPDNTTSRVGRTKTSPAIDAETPLNIAVFSCQDYENGYFSAYRHLIDSSQSAEEEVDFILHVGDFIYEGIRGPNTFDDGDLSGNQVTLFNRDGTRRRVGQFPSGGKENKRKWMVPTNLEDYRHLYKVYLTDPDLQDARALYPFVQTWDDHELDNDYWQSYYKTKSVADIKVASNKAWFEFIPAALSMGGRDTSDHHAKDFSEVDVTNTSAEQFDENYLSREPNNLAAIGSMTIYRSVKWGKLAELFVVDGRSYRGPRGLPQELLTVGRHPYPEGPIEPELIEIMNAGRNYANGNPPKRVNYLGTELDNPRSDAPMGSMLGGIQKDWLKKNLVETQAKWKLLGFNVGLMRHGFDDSFRESGGKNRILWTDGWDGYPVERRELTKFIKDKNVQNVVCLTGDRHAHMAGYVYDDFDSDDPIPVMAEFAGSSVSAPCRLVIQRILMAHDPKLAELTSFRLGEGEKFQPAMNAWMLHGHKSALSVREGDNEVLANSDPQVCPHLRYMDTDAYGYYRVKFNSSIAKADFVAVEEPVQMSEAKARRTVSFELTPGEQSSPELRFSGLEGEPPLGGLKT